VSREAIETGAFSWSRIQRLYDADPVMHWQRCESEGLQCPQEVFTQLFEEINNDDFAVIVRAVDWGRVRWELEELSGIALRHVRVDRGYQHGLDEARDRATQSGIMDERQEVVDHWRDAKSWIVPPVIVGWEAVSPRQARSDSSDAARPSLDTRNSLNAQSKDAVHESMFVATDS